MKTARLITPIFLLLLGLLSLPARAGVEITYIHNDALGSSVAGTDELGNVKWRSQYQPYGEERLGERSLFGVRSGYTGHREDVESGLVYMGARYYSPELGRFMGVDPVGVSANNIHSFNRYAYANNNPYKYIDPDGRFAFLAYLATPPGIAALEYTGTALVAFIGGIIIADEVIQPAIDRQFNENAGDNERSTDDPVDLEEDLAGQEILGDFANGGGEIINDKMNDPRFGPNGTHDKLSGNHTHSDETVTEVHADRNRRTGELSNTKFKTGVDNKKSR